MLQSDVFVAQPAPKRPRPAPPSPPRHAEQPDTPAQPQFYPPYASQPFPDYQYAYPPAPSYHPAWPHPAPYRQPQPWPPAHASAPSKQDEPILAPGELPAPRPPMSYAALIGEALLLAPPPHQLFVSEISDSIKKRYPYYRQNPTKIYNGVRHQTSMCKAFVKLPRAYGDQSGGARHWGIRAGCESWFAGGGYHPPTNVPTTNKKSASGKARSTARSKHLAVGTGGDLKKLPPGFPSPDSSDGPSSGLAYDGTNGTTPRPLVPYPQPSPYHSSPTPNAHLPPGYHYVPVNQPQPHPASQQPMFVPVWGPYDAPPAPYIPHDYQPGSQSPETWRINVAEETKTLAPHATQVKVVHTIESPAPSNHSFHESLHSSHVHSPDSL